MTDRNHLIHSPAALLGENMRYLVICSVKNEGPYLVEWICWYRMLGFTDIMILSNDCTDHSTQLLDQFQDAGWITHVPVAIPVGEAPTRYKLNVARKHALSKVCDWTFICDVDEFLTININQGLISDLIPPHEAHSFLGMAINWRCFGTSGHKSWSDDLVHRKFTKAARKSADSGRWLKVIFRNPTAFQVFAEHGPWKVAPVALAEMISEKLQLWVNSERIPLHQWRSEGPYFRMMEHNQVSYRNAQLNHYIIRDEASFQFKMGTRSPVSSKDRYTKEFFRNFNRNEETDTTCERYYSRFDKIHQDALLIPMVQELHHKCCNELLQRMHIKESQS